MVVVSTEETSLNSTNFKNTSYLTEFNQEYPAASFNKAIMRKEIHILIVVS